MLISPRSERLSFIGMSYNDIRSDRSHPTNASSLIPPTQLPKHFNVPFAIQHGYFRCVRYLLELSSDPNERDQQLRTPLILCSYIENDRWSLSLAQNLLEKGAKIALGDHARRNAMHHACALQRINLVQLYLTCLDFNIESKDCEGNTCLHYVAITGNCEIAELLIKTAEKMNIHLDQYVNREGCSAAILALKYGHIECANQITHRDWDEFFVVPRPLSIFETPPTTDVSHTLSTTANPTKLKKKMKNNVPVTSMERNDIRPSALSFGLLKIIFNEADSTYSTRLAGLCQEKKQPQRRRRVRSKKHPENPTDPPQLTHYCSTEALVNEMQTSVLDQRSQVNFDETDDPNQFTRTSPRMQLLMQQHGPIDPKSNSSLNYIEPAVSVLYESPRAKSKLQRPRTVVITRNQNSVNAVGIPSRLSSPKIPPRRSLLLNRPNSASVPPKPHYSHITSEMTTYSQTLYNGRPLSAVLHSQHPRHPPAQRTIDSSCTIREAKGAVSRYNNPEELFGLKPEELFGRSDHQPKIINSRKPFDLSRTTNHRSNYVWQDDVDKLIDLYNVHHSSNYKKAAVPPPPPVNPPVDQITDLPQSGKARATPLNKHSSNSSRIRSPTSSKQSTFSTITIPRRNSISQRPTIKLTNA